MAGNPTRPSKAIEFSRTALRSASTRYPRYYITDKVPRQGSSDWKRIVAVVVQVSWRGSSKQHYCLAVGSSSRGNNNRIFMLMFVYGDFYGGYVGLAGCLVWVSNTQWQACRGCRTVQLLCTNSSVRLFNLG
jgi:hypothetical protein